MKKNTFKYKKISTSLLSFVFVALSTFCFEFEPKVYAGTCDEDLLEQPTRLLSVISCNVKKFDPHVSIQRTVDDIINHAITGGVSGLALNSSPDDIGICAAYLLYLSVERIEAQYPGTINQADLDAIYGPTTTYQTVTDAAIDAVESKGLQCDYNSTAFGSKAAGSLLGVTKYAYDTVSREPVPVNLAYYVKHNLKKIPIVNQTALAATSYKVWGLELVLGLWETSKNIAYALMAVIMLIIGILIITRKKINPQTVVNVQMAVPRVILSLILITFSYPIGAVLASLSMPLLMFSVYLFFANFLRTLAQVFITDVFNVPILDMGALITFAGMTIQRIGAGGAIGVVIGLLLVVITVILLLIVVMKAFFINVKIMFSIITAPLEFAIGAIPGQEAVITNWFKHMIVRVLSIPAMFFMIALAWYFLMVSFVSPTLFPAIITGTDTNIISQGFSLLRGTYSRQITFAFMPLMTLMILFMATKVEKKLEEFIVGTKRR